MTGFSLIETMRWEPGTGPRTGPATRPATGIVRLRLHLARLTRSAARLGFSGADRAEDLLSQNLPDAALPDIPGKEQSPLRVRLSLDNRGRIDVVTAPFTPLSPDAVWTIRIAKARLDPADPLLRYKTSRRDAYEAARAEYTMDEADEVLLLNDRGEPCEGTITSIFLDDGSGQLKTPPIACGLLAGVLRTELICQRKARVQRLTRDDLNGGQLYVGNSLRGLIRATLQDRQCL